MTVVVRSATTPPQPAAVDDRAKSALKGEVQRRTAEGLAGRVRGSVLTAADAVVDERLLAPPLASRSDDGLTVVAELGGPVSAAYVRALRLESDAAFTALAQIGGSDAVLGLAERAARSGPRRAAALEALMRLATGQLPADAPAPSSPRAIDAWTRGLAPLRESAIASALLTLDEIAAEEPRATVVRDAVLAAAEPLLDRAPGVQTVSLAGVPQPVVEELARLFRKAEEFERLYHVAQGQVQLASDRASEAQRRYTELKARGPQGQGQPRGPRPDRPQREGAPQGDAQGASAAGATGAPGPAHPDNNAPPPEGGATREPQYVLGPDGQPVLGPDGQPLRKKRRRRRRRGGRGGGQPGAAPGAPGAPTEGAGGDEGGDDGDEGGDEGSDAPPT